MTALSGDQVAGKRRREGGGRRQVIASRASGSQGQGGGFAGSCAKEAVFFRVPRMQSSRLRLPAAILVEREVPGDRRGEAAGSGSGQTLPGAGGTFQKSELLSAGAWRVFKLQIATYG